MVERKNLWATFKIIGPIDNFLIFKVIVRNLNSKLA